MFLAGGSGALKKTEDGLFFFNTKPSCLCQAVQSWPLLELSARWWAKRSSTSTPKRLKNTQKSVKCFALPISNHRKPVVWQGKGTNLKIWKCSAWRKDLFEIQCPCMYNIFQLTPPVLRFVKGANISGVYHTYRINIKHVMWMRFTIKYKRKCKKASFFLSPFLRTGNKAGLANIKK